MTKRTQFTLVISAFTLAVLACRISSAPTPMPVLVEPVSVPTAEFGLPFEGMWVSEGDAPAIIIFTKDSMYWVQSDQVSADQVGLRERFAKVVAYDVQSNHITLRTQWIRVNGDMVGFDAPNFNITYAIDGNTLQVGIGWDEEFAAETDPLVYVHR